MGASTQWQTVVSQLPPGELPEEVFWLLLDKALRLTEDEHGSPVERRKAALDTLYLFKAQMAFLHRDKKRPDRLIITYRAFLPTIHKHAGATWSELLLDELTADEVDLVLDAVHQLMADHTEVLGPERSHVSASSGNRCH